MSLLRFWRNTSVAATHPGGTATLVQNYLGYEWDESPDNGFRPAGLIHLSSTPLQVDTYLLDYGANIGTYNATHNLALYRHPTSHALVFGAGTVFWVWGLDSNHDTGEDQTTPTDPNVQQATVNLFADMGVQPQTLQAGLVAATVSTDTTAPVSTINNPGSVTQQLPVTITGTATDTGGGIVAGVEVSTDGGNTWHPATGTATGYSTWSYNWWALAPGTYNIRSRAVDDSLNLEAPGAGISVTVTPGGTLSFFNVAAVSPWGGRSAPALSGPTSDNGAVELGLKFQTSAPGTVSALRFYKNPWNIGTHVGNLWNASGTLLASATFANETPSGWQQVNLSSPVTLSVGATYIVSYHSTAGKYSFDGNFFTTVYSSGPLHTVANGGPAVFAYGSTSVFPSNSDGASNYWADVVFNRSGGAGNEPPVANTVSGFATTTNTPLTIATSAILANDTDPNGYALSFTGVSNPTNGAVSYDNNAQTVTFTPTTGYPSPNATGTASFSYGISNGNGGTATGLVTLIVTGQMSSLFTASQTPTVQTVNDPNAVELGLKFQSRTAGQAIGVRFYKGTQNTGVHVGNLWNSSGALLASVTFMNESSSGWQQAFFSSPVNLTSGTTYVVSYHTSGLYSADANYFTNSVTNGVLTAPSNATSGGNGVYAYGNSSVFPTNSYNAANYWVDIVFSAQLGGPPVANPDSGFVTPENTALQISASTLLANDSDPSGYTLSITGVSSPSNGTVTYDGSQVVTFVPATNYMGAAGFTYSITNGHGGTASASVSLTVIAPVLSLFSASSSPANVTINDSSAVELGVKFQSSVAGKVVGVQFYKGPQNVGTHTGNLWLGTGGSPLATATFANESASGWQQVYFASPVTITPGTTYIVSYHTNGFYSADGNYFANALTNGPLTAPS
ncbi:MAG: DUF4082 domain-containing protein, partial [Candidatus Eremiobacteraeota bacterium]|nr:DUF4082 domain-containing protein [Candidatus Eremiobacteraeota bacterium]